MDLTVKGCSFNYEQPDGRYAVYLDDVLHAEITGCKMERPAGNEEVIKLKNSTKIHIDNISYPGPDRNIAPAK
jgi:hypothetical protein